ncbi:MAG TPA: DUF1028 domain-containing protein [Gaiellales bacterium]
MTFSLVACDLEARQWGVVVASKFLAVGAVVPWARAEVGAVATQASANVSYGPRGLELLAAGASAQETIDRLTGDDPVGPERQIGVVDAAGGSATFTGPECFDWAGGRAGPGYAAQGNLLAGAAVVEALADTFEGTEGPLVERLLASLAAGDEAGGDRRGRQSAAVIVREIDGGYGGGTDILIDLRVDDHADPVPELQRLYALQDLLFGRTPEDQLIPLEQVEAELSVLLGSVGHSGPIERGLREWAGMENLEERLHDGRIDPVVLRALRDRAEAGA